MIEFHIKTQAAAAEMLTNELTLFGVDAITWLDGANQPLFEPLPGEIIPWQAITLVAFVSEESLLPAIHSYLKQQQKLAIITDFSSQTVVEKDWVRESLDQFQAKCFGTRLWICPSWQKPPQETAVNVLLDPGLAFGTGMHETTAMCLEWLDRSIAGGEVVVDYGCGSGILAVSALKLGAKQVIAVDHDPEALEATLANAKLNHICESALTVYLPEQVPAMQADIVIANILAKPLQLLAPLFYALLKPGGKVVISGILDNQADEVKASYAAYFSMQDAIVKKEWVCLSGYKAV